MCSFFVGYFMIMFDHVCSFLVMVRLLHSLWSFVQACFHLYYALAKKDLHQRIAALLLALGDAVTPFFFLSGIFYILV